MNRLNVYIALVLALSYVSNALPAPLIRSSLASNSTSQCVSREDAVNVAVAHASGQQYCECVCPANAPWRCDCSGLVSRAWGLQAPGLTTYDFNPGVCAKLGSRSELQPADVLLWPGDPAAHTGHVVMFVKWIDQGSTYIEAACHSPSEGCTHGPKSLSDYGDEFFACRPHPEVVCD